MMSPETFKRWRKRHGMTHEQCAEELGFKALEVTKYLVFDPERHRLRTVRAFLDLAEETTGEPWYKL